MKFIPIYEALTIKAQKNSPAYVAFEELIEKRSPATSEWAELAKKPATQLGVEKTSTPLYSKRVVLSEMVVKKTPEPIPATDVNGRLMASEATNISDEAWIEQLPRQSQSRLRAAQERSKVLNQDWQEPSFSDEAKEVLEKSGVLVGGVIQGNPKPTPNNTNPIYVSATDSHGNRNEVSRPQVLPQANQNPTTPDAPPTLSQKSLVGDDRGAARSIGRRIVGPIEIAGGLAITNEHHFEIRRSDEGVSKELGRVDLVQGTYNIVVDETVGSVVARLMDKEGKILGEGSFRLNRITAAANETYLQGPKLKIEPHPDYSGVVTDAYNAKVMDSAPTQTRVTLIKGATDVPTKKDGAVVMDNVTKGSTTVMRAAAPKYLQTSQIIVSGHEFRAPLYPNSMIKALQEIVGQQRAQTFDGEPTIIWGRVALDGKPVSGIDVSVESDPGLQPVYFNQFMIPDPQLKTTSDNGLFAFVDVTPGYHSLLATRSDSIFGYSNVVAEDGSVAIGDIDATIKSEAVALKIYDAFSGEARPATITMQSLSDELSVENGAQTLTLPHLNRVGLMRVRPEGSDYISARYLYNDSDEFIHVPLVQFNWLSSVKAALKIDDAATSGIVVGFVPDEDFEVYIAGYDQFDTRNIVYFDMQGRILQNRKGMGGGGFILYNVPEDTHEIVVIGSRSQKIYSKVLPVDANSLSVLNFRD
ncbi:MAG TPA: hypothetical protein VN132_12010 [Bdellovibrio sp.]|nr:hypothetical protein [Bdellovibrio sp.]